MYWAFIKYFHQACGKFFFYPQFLLKTLSPLPLFGGIPHPTSMKFSRRFCAFSTAFTPAARTTIVSTVIAVITSLSSIFTHCYIGTWPQNHAIRITTIPINTSLSATHRLPVTGKVLQPANIPEKNWNSGHRGVDLSAQPGDEIRASRGGTVHFAGSVAGTPTLSIMHPDGIRTTYEPVHATVRKGDYVRRGQVIGYLAAPEDSARQSQGLSWGAKIDANHYIDPMTLLGTPVIVLKG